MTENTAIWSIEIESKQWTISVTERMARHLGPKKKAWIEAEVKRLYPGDIDDPTASHHASTIFTSSGKDCIVFLDYNFAERCVVVSGD